MKVKTPPRLFFTFFKLYKWYQIAQRITSVYRWQSNKFYKPEEKCTIGITAHETVIEKTKLSYCSLR